MDKASAEPPLRPRLDTLGGKDIISVLHVDDDAEFADLVAVYLERENADIEVTTATDAEEALELYEVHNFDCVVSDYEMPGPDGLDLLESIRGQDPHRPFILFTGTGSESIASDAISAGVTDYFQKQSGTDHYTVLAKRIENAVKQYDARQQVERGFSAIETAREGIAFLDSEGTFQYLNPAFAEVYGYERDELVGEHWEILYPDDHVSQVYEEILPSIPEGGQWTGRSVQVSKTGDRLLTDHALRYCEDGTLLCLIQEIAEEEPDDHLNPFVDHIETYGICTLDSDGFITGWNQGATRILGYEKTDIIGEHLSALELTDEETVESLLGNALETGSVSATEQRRQPTGSPLYVDVHIVAITDADGVHTGYTVILQDIARTGTGDTDPADVIYHSLDVLDDVVFILNPSGDIVEVTERAADVTGYSMDDLVDMSALDLFPPDERDRVAEDIAEALETGSATLEATLVTKEGHHIPYEFRKRRVTDDNGNVWLAGVARDISDRARQERRLQRQLAQFEHFGSILSHDLRSPLNTAQGRVELAQETGEDSHLEQAQNALDRLEDLISDLAEVLKNGELVDEKAPISLGTIAESTWDGMDTGTATLVIEDDITIIADENALRRIFENVFANALDHAGEGVTVTLGATQDGFYVADDGPGIPESDRDQVFDAGFTTREEGHGFGLASVRQVVVAHGWGIDVTESEAGGARFEIWDVDRAEADHR